MYLVTLVRLLVVVQLPVLVIIFPVLFITICNLTKVKNCKKVIYSIICKKCPKFVSISEIGQTVKQKSLQTPQGFTRSARRAV